MGHLGGALIACTPILDQVLLANCFGIVNPEFDDDRSSIFRAGASNVPKSGSLRTCVHLKPQLGHLSRVLIACTHNFTILDQAPLAYCFGIVNPEFDDDRSSTLGAGSSNVPKSSYVRTSVRLEPQLGHLGGVLIACTPNFGPGLIS